MRFKQAFEEIVSQQIESKTLELVGMVLSDMLRISFESEMSESDQLELVKLIISIVRGREGEYRAMRNLFEGLISYVRMIHPGILESQYGDPQTQLYRCK